MAGPELIQIIDANDPCVEVFRDQKDAWLAIQRSETPADRRAGLFMAEGELVVRALIDSALGVHSVLLADNRLKTMRDAIGRLPPGVPVHIAPRDVVASIVGFDLHRGVLAAGIRPTSPTVDELASRCSTLVVLEDLTNHDNVGSLFRSTAALAGLGSAGMVLSPRCCDPLYRKAVRVSMGTALRLPWTVADDWLGALHTLAELGFETLALTPDDRATPIDQMGSAGTPGGPKRALVLGSEGPGLSEAAMAACAHRVRIPIDAAVDSLNVAVAGAVALAGLCVPG